MHPINTGIIGFGLSGKVFHAPFIHAHPGFELSAIVERHARKSKEIYPHISVLKSHEELLQNKNIELVIIATPNIHHFSMARDSLMAGKHLVIEKPFTPTVEEAVKLIQIAQEKDRKIFVYQNRRWDADFLTIKKLIKQDKLGDIAYYEAHFDRYSPVLKPHSWRDEDAPGGGILYDLGSHLIDQAIHLFGMPKEIKAEIGVERPGGIVDDSFQLKLLYPDQTIVLKAGMMVKNPGPRFIIEGSRARYTKYGSDPQESMLKTGKTPLAKNWGKEDESAWGMLENFSPGSEKECIKSERGNYMGFYNNVYDVLVNKKSMFVKPEEARDVIFIIEKAFESHNKNKTIKLINNPIKT
jgi:predicted dehydrogenase